MKQLTQEQGEGEERSATRTAAVYEQLRNGIVSGRLLPGEKLRVEALREKYGVGGSPLREALSRLAAEGLVLQQEQKGFRVAPVSPADLMELTRTRCWINEIALRESLANGDAAWEEQVLVAFHRLFRVPPRLPDEPDITNPAWSRLHQAFHTALIAACGSHWLIDFSNMLSDRADRYRNLVAASSSVERDMLGEHRELMEAVIERKTEQAIALLNAHISKTADLLLAASTDEGFARKALLAEDASPG